MHDTALGWLEQGRSIVWGQLLDFRSPVDELHTVDPGLADRLAQVSVELENAGHHGMLTEPLTIVAWPPSRWLVAFQMFSTFCSPESCRN